MAQVKFRRINSSTLPEGAVVDGQVLFLVGSKELYMGYNDAWVKFGDGDERVKDVAYANGTVTITYENGKTATTYASLASVSDTAVENQFVTGISAANGVVSATRSGITSSQVTRTATEKVPGTDVETALGNLADAIQTGGTGSVVTVTEVTTGLADSVLKAYKIYQGDTSKESNLKGTINIPKDLVVTSGSLVNGTWNGDTFTEAAAGSDKAIKLVIANQSAPIYINTTDLVDIYTAGPGITVTGNKISNDIDTAKGLMFTGSGDTAKTAVNVKSGDLYIEIDNNGAIASKGIDDAIDTKIAAAKVSVTDNADYITATVDAAGRVITIDDTIQSVASADDSHQGLAEASDVKSYVDGKVDAKNVSAEGDHVYITASAANNKVTVTGTYGSFREPTPINGIAKVEDVKAYVDGTKVSVTDNATYVTATVDNAGRVITISDTIQKVSTAGASAKGLAEASDVRDYVDTAVASKNVTAQGDDYVNASASNNAVTVATQIDNMTYTQGSVNTSTGAITASTLTGTANKLVDSADTATKVSNFVNSRISEELTWIEA